MPWHRLLIHSLYQSHITIKYQGFGGSYVVFFKAKTLKKFVAGDEGRDARDEEHE